MESIKKIGIIIFTAVVLFFYSCNQKIVIPSENDKLSERAIKGKEVFMGNCNSCHPGGNAGLGPSINNKPLPGFLIKLQVRNGIGTMPSFSKHHISDEELDNLVFYLKEFKKEKRKN